MTESTEKEINKKIISGMKWVATLKIVGQLYAWVVTFAIIRILNPSDFGLHSMLEAPLDVLMLVAVVGIDAALIRYRITSRESLSNIFGFLLVSNVLVAVALAISAGFIADHFAQPRLVLLIQISAAVFLFVPFRVIPNALLDLNLDFKLKAQVDIAASLSSSTISLLVALMGGGVWALVAALLLNPLVKTVLLSILRPWFIRPTFNFPAVSFLLKYGAQLVIGSALSLLAGKLLIVIVGPQLGPETLGLYAVAVLFSLMPLNKFMPVIQQTLMPAYSKFQHDQAMLRKYILKAIELSLLLMMPLSIGMAYHSTEIVRLILGEKWMGASGVFMAFSLLLVFRLANFIFHTPLTATGHAKFITLIQFIAFLILTVGAFVAVDHGLNGLVVLSSVNIISVALVMLVGCARFYSISVHQYLAAARPAFIGTVFMLGTLLIASWILPKSYLWLELLQSILLGIIAYAAAVNLFIPKYWYYLYQTFRNDA